MWHKRRRAPKHRRADPLQELLQNLRAGIAEMEYLAAIEKMGTDNE